MNYRHGMRDTKAYRSWDSMIQRCTNPSNNRYSIYAGWGITIHSDFLGIGGFEKWYKEIGSRPEGQYSQDRIDNERGYTYGNIHWATPKEQRANQRVRSNATKHGNLSMYTSRGCRCSLCKKAQHNYYIKRKNDGQV